MILRDAQASAKMLRSTIEGMNQGANPACKFRCNTEFGCNECIAANLTVGCPAQGIKSAPTVDMEWIANTGRAQDLVSISTRYRALKISNRRVETCQHDDSQRP